MKTNEIKKALENQLAEEDVSRILAQLKGNEANDMQSTKGISYSNLEKCAKDFPNLTIVPACHEYTIVPNDKGSIDIIDNWVAPKIYGTADNILKLFAKVTNLSDIAEGTVKNSNQASNNKLDI